MKRYLSIIFFNLVTLALVHAQNTYRGLDDRRDNTDRLDNPYIEAPPGGFDPNTNTFNPNARSKGEKAEKKIIPQGMYVWTIDPLFGDRIPVEKDTLQHLFMNTVFTSGMYGEYNTTGNLGAPRQNRIFMDRSHIPSFLFTDNYDFFLTPIEDLRFTNTLSPITRLDFYSCGDRTDGEDYLKVLFASNVNKRLGFGMKFNYMYGRGYYNSQSTALFDYTLWTSYIGERYQAHFAFSTDHMKNAENGGITEDKYVTNPEQQLDSYTSLEIPTNLMSNWSKNNALHFYLSHRYNVGFYRKVPMTKQEIEAKKFALASRKEAEDREKMENGDVDAKGRVNETLAGRPKDAKIEGDLPTDSLSKAANDRISVGNEAVADSLLAEKAKAAEDTSWMKNEYVPVTSFIHTATVDRYTRNYIAYRKPANYYPAMSKADSLYWADLKCADDTINDIANYTKIDNTFALALLEGFNKYVPTGLKAYITHDIGVYELFDKKYHEHSTYIGGQLTKTLGSVFHYNATADYCFAGEMSQDFMLDATADVNVPIFGDTVRIDMDGFYHSLDPDFFLCNYHSKHYSWNHEDFNKQKHTHFGGAVSFPKTKTSVRVGWDFISDYTYLATWHELSAANLQINHRADVLQAKNDVHVFTAELAQDFKAGILNWENRITYQLCEQDNVLPLPKLNVWSNLYIDFKIAKVLKCHFGADVSYFTRYYAPEYVPALGQFAVQTNGAVKTKVGNYPFVDVYANFVLKGCRFFVMMSHVNMGQKPYQYFTVPHYPMNERVFRFGISWNFNN